MSSTEVLYTIRKLKSQYPYLKKAVQEIHQTNIGEVYSLDREFEYDGTPGIFAKETNEQNLPDENGFQTMTEAAVT